MEKIQIEESDIISFHNYDAPDEFEKRIVWLAAIQAARSCAPNTWRVATQHL